MWSSCCFCSSINISINGNTNYCCRIISNRIFSCISIYYWIIASTIYISTYSAFNYIYIGCCICCCRAYFRVASISSSIDSTRNRSSVYSYVSTLCNFSWVIVATIYIAYCSWIYFYICFFNITSICRSTIYICYGCSIAINICICYLTCYCLSTTIYCWYCCTWTC